MAELSALIGRRFARSEPREQAIADVRGVLSAEKRKNSWTLSERAGDATPNGMQRLLSTTDWAGRRLEFKLHFASIDWR